MSISIGFDNVVKKYGSNTVIPGLSLEIEKGEFFTLLGPSGCGKTTLLRMVAGFNSIEGGTITFNDEVINNKPPQKRNIGMVFQNYAIFPHLTVKENVEFGMKTRKLPKQEINKKIKEILKIVQIEEYMNRLPENLSGGQQQRVALARAIVIEPNVLLMDEPLSNLDAKLRIDLRNAIKEIQKSIGITTMYVTHDQEEAMAISDRIAVMKDGIIQHIGTPQNIYHRPANVFVASFIGRTNLLERKIRENGQNREVVLDEGYSIALNNLLDDINGDIDGAIVSIRPEEFEIRKSGEGISGTIFRSIFLGLNTHYFVKLNTGQIVEVIGESTLGEIIEPGTKIKLKVDIAKINIFNKKNKMNMTKGVVNDAEN